VCKTRVLILSLQTNEIIVRKVNKEIRRKYFGDSKNKIDDQEEFDKLIGFGKFFNLLMDKKLPLIGHNLLLDLMMMFQQFIGPLPGKTLYLKLPKLLILSN
jgi:CAF1 family ribonuclease